MKSKSPRSKPAEAKASKPTKPTARDLTVKQAGAVKGGATIKFNRL
jgi:hypothetical protein